MMMKCFGLLLLAPVLCLMQAASAAEMTLAEPADYQVFQRTTRTTGTIRIRGTIPGVDLAGATFEARVGTDRDDPKWQQLTVAAMESTFEAKLQAPAGGWRQFEIRATRNGQSIGAGKVEHVGVGEVFVVAGQSNSANYGETKQTTRTGRVATYNGTKWQLSNDPQPGAGGKGGSFMPPLGDLLVDKLDVPVGFIACGIGATSVREWLPKGAVFPNPPTIVGRVKQRDDGQWESKGDAYNNLIARLKSPGERGFRAVLWHQGESDANQKDATRTLPGKLYREHLERIIRDSRKEIGWDAPWFVAQVSYHVPGDEASPDIRDAQASLWRDGVALEGPDSDALKGDLRERKGQGVHFSEKGLKEHAAKWAEKLLPWIEKQTPEQK